ncbi:hypothetical protein DFH29DRAFT_1005153 [Suillus ampliporus]|nr:hypothetical protein DFH29DRAFT_1005153 [Suillus ampliporus]
MPSNDENIQMACDAILQVIASHADLPPDKYYLPREETFISSLTKITNTICATFKHVPLVIMQDKYNLELDVCDASSEIMHKLQMVPTLISHLQCLFKIEQLTLDGTLQPVAVLKHEVLVSVVMEVLWTNGFYKDIDLEDPEVLNGVIALGSTALCSVIKEYETGVFKCIDFSTAKSGDTYCSIRTYISSEIYPHPELAAHFKTLKTRMREHREERLGL